MVQSQGIPLVARNSCGASQDRIAAGAALHRHGLHVSLVWIDQSATPSRCCAKGRSTSYAGWDNGHEDNSPENGTCRTMAGSKSQTGVEKATQMAACARAALFRKFANREPTNKGI